MPVVHVVVVAGNGIWQPRCCALDMRDEKHPLPGQPCPVSGDHSGVCGARLRVARSTHEPQQALLVDCITTARFANHSAQPLRAAERHVIRDITVTAALARISTERDSHSARPLTQYRRRNGNWRPRQWRAVCVVDVMPRYAAGPNAG